MLRIRNAPDPYPALDFDADPAYHSDAYAVPDPDLAVKMMRIRVRNTPRFCSNLFLEGSLNFKIYRIKRDCNALKEAV